MRKRVPRLLLASALLLLGVATVAVLGLNSSVQTWAAHRYLARRPELGLGVGSVSVSPGKVQLTQVRLARPGFSVLLPAVDLDLTILRAARGDVRIGRLVARGWTLDLTKAGPEDAAPAALFPSILSQIQLPVDLALEEVEMEGEVIIPAATGQPPVRARLTIKGGGLGAGRKGRLDFTAGVTLAQDRVVSDVAFQGGAVVTMSTPRAFSALALELSAEARGPKLPQGARLQAALAASRANSGEVYALTLESAGRKLAQMQAVLPASNGGGPARLNGTWDLDLSDAEVSPFTLGRPLPTFSVKGSGRFEADTAGADLAVDGRVEMAADGLGIVQPKLASVGVVKLVSEFDLRHASGGWEVRRLMAELAGSQPALTVRALQAFEFNPDGGVLKVADRDQDLVALELRGFPVGWLQALLPAGADITSGELRGNVAIAARNGGFAMRSAAPLTAGGVVVWRDGNMLAGPADVALRLSGDYTPQGWQVEVADFTARTGGLSWLSGGTKAGRLAGKGQPLKVVGNWSADLPGLLSELGLARATTITRGRATGDFTASVGSSQELEAHVAVSNLAALPSAAAEALPGITAALQASLESDGRVAWRLPLELERAGRKSDLKLDGYLTPGSGSFGVDARATSIGLVLEDAQVLGALVGARDQAGAAEAGPSVSAVPFWSGITGRVGLDLKKVTYRGAVEWRDVTGTLRMEAGAFRLESGRASFAGGGEVTASAGLAFDRRAPEPYALRADVALTEMASAPLFLALNPGRTPTVDGVFSVTSQLVGTGRYPAELLDRARGEFQLVSKGGTFRLLHADVADKIQTTQSRLSAAVGFLGELAGQDRIVDAAKRAQNVSDVAKALDEFKFDQLVVTATRAPGVSLKLTDFSLISTEVRLTGAGEISQAGNLPLLSQEMDLRLMFSARGRLGELMGRTGLLGEPRDALGYLPFIVPLRIGGTPGQPDNKELVNALVRAAGGSLLDNLLKKP